jgi:hypothetical protein
MKETQERHIESMKSQARELRLKELEHKKFAEVYAQQALDLEMKASTLEWQGAQAKTRRKHCTEDL